MPSHDSQDPQPDGSPRSNPENVDAEFAKIVASFDAAPEWPAAEPAPEAEKPGKGPVWPAAGPVLNQPSLLDGLDTFGAHLPDETPESFIPPPPPPLPKIPFAAILAVAAIILGFVLFFDRELLPVHSNVSMLLGVSGVLGGAAALIMRLRPGHDDDPGDDGAVV